MNVFIGMILNREIFPPSKGAGGTQEKNKEEPFREDSSLFFSVTVIR